MGIEQDIIDGKYDDNIDGIVQAVNIRRDMLSRSKFYDFKVGDKVRIVGQVRPKYLQGMEATVSEKRRSKLVIRLTDSTVSGRFARGLVVGAGVLEKI